ncbi:hypothetical protein TA3x_000855 [Tundrisphaera sp. TA3]|uniref:hypothetical protein n=1 Tax=Tundrisphaera sp. TA3 TaxID=3435775 RepID=UPI003EBA04DA
MTIAIHPAWEAKRTEETRQVEGLLRQHFDQVDSYRYNAASIRVRVIDPRFEGVPRDERDLQVEAQIAHLPETIQRDIVTIFCFAPSELDKRPETFREFMLNAEFDDPSPSML